MIILMSYSFSVRFLKKKKKILILKKKPLLPLHQNQGLSNYRLIDILTITVNQPYPVDDE